MRRRLAELVALPTIITKPGEYVTRCGEIAVITEINGAWGDGHYKAEGITESWDVSGRLLPFNLTRNDIVAVVK